MTSSPRLPKGPDYFEPWGAFSRHGFVELLYTSPSSWTIHYPRWTENWPINQVVFSERPSLTWERTLQPSGVEVRCMLEGRLSGRKTYQTQIAYPWGMTETSLGAPAWADGQARRLAGSVEPYEAFWPQIRFHVVLRRDSDTDDGGRYVLQPESDCPLGDLLQRHAFFVEPRGRR